MKMDKRGDRKRNEAILSGEEWARGEEVDSG
jgi:hypothetical protein